MKQIDMIRLHDAENRLLCTLRFTENSLSLSRVEADYDFIAVLDDAGLTLFPRAGSPSRALRAPAAAALLKDGRILAFGAANGASVTRDFMRLRLYLESPPKTAAPAPAEKPAQTREPEATHPPEPAQTREAESTHPPEPAQTRESEATHPPEPAQTREAEATHPPEPTQTREAGRVSLSEPMPAHGSPEIPAVSEGVFVSAPAARPPSEKSTQPAGEPAPEAMAQTAAADAQAAGEAADFAALMARVERVFADIHARRPPEPQPRAQARSFRPPRDAPPLSTLSDGRDEDWYETVDTLLHQNDVPAHRPVSNPFPNIFPGARFLSIDTGGRPQRLEGEWVSGGESKRITAVQGAYSPRPPAPLSDFTRYIRTRKGGWWIRIR